MKKETSFSFFSNRMYDVDFIRNKKHELNVLGTQN